MHKYSRIPSLVISDTSIQQQKTSTKPLVPRWQKIQNIPSAWLYFLLCLIALSFNLFRLGNPSIWFDEAFSVELARQPLPLLWHLIFGPEPNMELYYLFLHYWLLLTHTLGFNPIEVVVRLPSAIFAALSTGVVFLLGRRFLNMTAGILAASLYLLNDLQLTYAQQTRGYSLQLLLLCLSWYILFTALTTKREFEGLSWLWWLGYILTTVLAVYTQLFSLLVMVAQCIAAFTIWLLYPGMPSRRLHSLLAMTISLGVIGLLILPLLWISRHGSKTGWLPVPHLHDIYGLFLTICGNNKIYLVLASLLIAAGAYLCFRQWHHPGGENKYHYAIIALLCWLIIPVIISYIVSQGPTRLFSSRYLVVVVPPFCLLIGMGLALIPWRIIRTVLMLGILLLALKVVPLYYASVQVENWNTATHWLEQHYQANDGIVCYDNVQGCQIAVQYYLDAYPGPAHFDVDAPGAYSWTKYGPVNPITGYEAAVLPSALARYAAHHPRLFFVTGRIPDQPAATRAQQTIRWLDQHYHLLGQYVTPTVVVRLYATE